MTTTPLVQQTVPSLENEGGEAQLQATAELVALQVGEEDIPTFINNPGAVERGGKLLDTISHCRASISKDLTGKETLILRAKCKGTQATPYDVSVKLDVDTAAILSATCTCPVANRCKHCAGVLLHFCSRYDEFTRSTKKPEKPRPQAIINVGPPEPPTLPMIPAATTLIAPEGTPGKRKLPWNANQSEKKKRKKRESSPKEDDAPVDRAPNERRVVTVQQAATKPVIRYIQTDDEILEAANKYLLPFRQQRLQELEEEQRRRQSSGETSDDVRAKGKAAKRSGRSTKGGKEKKIKVTNPEFWNVIEAHQQDMEEVEDDFDAPILGGTAIAMTATGKTPSPVKKDSFLEDDPKYRPRTSLLDPSLKRKRQIKQPVVDKPAQQRRSSASTSLPQTQRRRQSSLVATSDTESTESEQERDQSLNRQLPAPMSVGRPSGVPSANGSSSLLRRSSSAGRSALSRGSSLMQHSDTEEDEEEADDDRPPVSSGAEPKASVPLKLTNKTPTHIVNGSSTKPTTVQQSDLGVSGQLKESVASSAEQKPSASRIDSLLEDLFF